MSNRRKRFVPLPIHRRLQRESAVRRHLEQLRKAAATERGRDAVRVAHEHAESGS